MSLLISIHASMIALMSMNVNMMRTGSRPWRQAMSNMHYQIQPTMNGMKQYHLMSLKISAQMTTVVYQRLFLLPRQ